VGFARLLKKIDDRGAPGVEDIRDGENRLVGSLQWHEALVRKRRHSIGGVGHDLILVADQGLRVKLEGFSHQLRDSAN
jgi:hypothetical protein